MCWTEDLVYKPSHCNVPPPYLLASTVFALTSAAAWTRDASNQRLNLLAVTFCSAVLQVRQRGLIQLQLTATHVRAPYINVRIEE